MATILDGKKIAKCVKEQIKENLAKIKEEDKKQLIIIQVGDDPASSTYIKNKEKACAAVGMPTYTYHLTEKVPVKLMVDLIHELNEDSDVSGIMLQLPLPKHLDAKKLCDCISPDKDVDCFNAVNIGFLTRGNAVFYPCTPKGIMTLLSFNNIDVAGKHCVIVGRSNIVGKPLALLMLQKDATVTVCHSKTANLKEITSQADILVSAVGKPNFITADMVKEGAVVIDVGINRVDGKLCGDVDFEAVEKKCSAITPVPGGVGPMTVSMLLLNNYVSMQNLIENS